jgi:hypothetical protein
MERRVVFCLVVTLGLFGLASCSEEPQTLALNAAEHPPGPDEQGPALDQLIAKRVKRDPVFFANHDFSEKQADYLRARLDALPDVDKSCVEKNLRDSFGERMAACEASGQWSFVCEGCKRISDSVLYDPAAMITGMKMCGVDFELPKWE